MLLSLYPVWVVVFLCNLVRFPTIHSIHDGLKQNGNSTGFSVRMIHIYSPQSPLYESELTQEERMERLVHMSHTRFQSISASENTNTSSFSLQPQGYARPSIHTQQFIYVVQIGIGQFDDPNNPYYTYYFILDTGTDVTWTQCEGCTACFRQRDPYFPRSRSKTYRQLPCRQCPPSSQCEGDHCAFTQIYGDGASMKGVWAMETFTFESDLDQVETVPNLYFGCGIEMRNFAEDNMPGNIISGMLGLSFGPLSFVTQLKTRALGTFSYCLQLVNPGGGDVSPMFLRFGEDVIRVPDMVSTPIQAVPNRPWYYLNLLDLSVADQKLNIPSEIFSIKSDGSGGTIIDSGATFGYITSDAYAILENAIATFIKNNNPNLIRIPPEQNFQACWARLMDPPDVNLPSVTYHFENADFVVQQDSVFYIGKTRYVKHDMYCLAIYSSSPGNTKSSLGAFQQANHRIIYELPQRQLTFAAADCNHAN